MKSCTCQFETYSVVCSQSAVKECASSSPTSYFWFRRALNITNSIDESGEFNYIMTGCLLAAWAIVSLAMIKGIKSSAKVSYSLFFTKGSSTVYISTTTASAHIYKFYACVTVKSFSSTAIIFFFFQLSGDVLFLSLSLCGALYFPHQRIDVGRRNGRSHLYVLP